MAIQYQFLNFKGRKGMSAGQSREHQRDVPRLARAFRYVVTCLMIRGHVTYDTSPRDY